MRVEGKKADLDLVATRGKDEEGEESSCWGEERETGMVKEVIVREEEAEDDVLEV